MFWASPAWSTGWTTSRPSRRPGLFGGNSNWRGPVWFPVNYLIIESLQKFHFYLGDDFKVECPRGSGQMMTLWDVAGEISRRLNRLFLRDANGRRPVFGGNEKFQTDPHFKDYVLFHEYFHGDNGAGSERIGAKRLVIDSLVGFEMALAPGFRTDFRESLYRMIGGLTGAGVTVLSTVEVEDTFTALPFSQYTISFLTDDIIRMRYVEIDGQLRKVMVVIKMRGGNHSKDIREYVITDKGVVVIHPRSTDYNGLTTGIPTRTGPRQAQEEERAPEPKAKK